jgi:hypothetical protein
MKAKTKVKTLPPFKVGQIVKNKRTGLVRRITKVSKDTVFWISKDGKRKGSCGKYTLRSWVAGTDHPEN